MGNYFYEKHAEARVKGYLRLFSLLLSLLGFFTLLYIFFPLISWQFYFAPVFASGNLITPIPKTTVVSSTAIQSLFKDSFSGIDYTNASNWFPSLQIQEISENKLAESYKLSIPKLGIDDATVSTVDVDLRSHLVNFPGTAIPSQKGTSVIFGHSTLPQLFNQKDYSTIFATAYLLKEGDEIFAEVNGVTYKYRVFSISVVGPDDTSPFIQNYDDNYLTLVTCTPPGTTWKRLIIKTKMEQI